MRKRAILIVGVALLIAAAGVVYAHWTETLYVDATVQSGTMTMAWTNASNGASGTPIAAWTCSQDFMTWTSGPVPLAPGNNTITVTFTDRAGSTRASVVAVRR